MVKIFIFAVCMILSAGCVTLEPPGTVSAASADIRAGKADCIVIQNGKVAALAKGRGLSPLLNLYLDNPGIFKGSVVVDKVIGRAAAFVIISGGAVQAHGELISEDAIALLKKHDISVSGSKIVPRILNRKMDGICPLEQSVLGITEPAQALTAMQKRIAELSRKK